MSVFARLRMVRVILGVGITVRAVAWGIVAALSLVAGAAIADAFVDLSVGSRRSLLLIAVASAVITAAALAWRDRRVSSLLRVALWIEEREPALQFALASAVETGDERLVRAGGSDRWTRSAIRRALRAVAIPLAAGIAAVVVLFALPAGAVARIRSPRAGDALARGGPRPPGASRLSPLIARLQPPAYTDSAATTIDDPADLRVVVGSTVVLEGRGDAAGIVAITGGDALAASSHGDRWSVTVRVSKPLTVRLRDGPDQRLVAIEPIADNPPTVTLTAPAHDSVLRAARGRLILSADVSDDFGLASAAFEYIVSSGEGETFTFKSGTLGARPLHGARATFVASLPFDSLPLKPGDIVHLRAVARDANNVTGPGIGASETRTIRIARADEYDSVAVDAVPPSEADKSLISERMLIQLAAALEKRRPSLARDTLVRESHSIAVDQKRLRRTVGEIVFSRLGEPTGEEHTDDESPARAKSMEELIARADSATNRSTDPIDFAGGESPVVATNKPLLEAYNAMWDASTELELGQPGRALPHMRLALAAIQRARQAERLYLRGQPPPVVIDLAKVRLTGKDKGGSSARRPLTAVDSTRVMLTTRLLRIAELSARDTRAALDSLLVLRIAALSVEPAFATAVGDAATAMRSGNGVRATTAFVRARRALAGAPAARDSLSRWGLMP